ncbi:MAG: GldG family protein [Bacteroidales bacterium]|nr:GldG family protein [Bacteroidales bacterium]
MKTRNNINIRLLIILAIIIVINFISLNFFFRLDVTADGRYSLSDATRNILRNLDETVTITAYFTEDMPPNLLNTRQEFKDMLVEFSNLSGGNVVYEFINPNKDQESEQKANQNGIRPVLVSDREKDQITQKKIYIGAVLQVGGEKAIIPVIQPGSAMEYDLASNIKKLSVTDKPRVALLQGHGEPRPQALMQAMEQLSVLYEVVPLGFSDSAFIKREFKTLAIIAPQDSLRADEIAMLDQFMADGGRLFIAMNRVNGDLQQGRGFAVSNGIESWLASKGIILEDKFVVDANCSMVGVRQQQGGFTMTTNMPFPYLPNITNFADHPATKGLETVMFPFVSPISFEGDTAIHYIPLARSSKQSGTEAVPLIFDVNKTWTENEFSDPGQVVAAAFEGPISGNTLSRMVLIGNGNFGVNGEGQRPQQLQPDNVSLLANSIDWLTDETGLIDLRTKVVTSRPIDQLSESKKTFLRWLNFALPLVLTILFGIIWYQRKRIIRKKRMEEGYV